MLSSPKTLERGYSLSVNGEIHKLAIFPYFARNSNLLAFVKRIGRHQEDKLIAVSHLVSYQAHLKLRLLSGNHRGGPPSIDQPSPFRQ